jgi:trehalose 6-phosphate phosphatase
VNELLAPLRQHPRRSAIVCDIDGTIAPIAARAEEAVVPRRARELLTDLNRRYAFVACVSGRRAADARRVVGIGPIAYIGNHGLEYLAPGARRAEAVPAASEHAADVRAFANEVHTRKLRNLGVRLEDKDSTCAFHWREAPEELSARAAVERVAQAAERRGLVPHWGRKVLEIRPPIAYDKGTALVTALRDAEVESALYAGDDATDLDAFRKLREVREAGGLKHAVCVGVRSDESPTGITRDADLVVDGPRGFLELLAALAA